jgi:hypothetical protein
MNKPFDRIAARGRDLPLVVVTVLALGGCASSPDGRGSDPGAHSMSPAAGPRLPRPGYYVDPGVDGLDRVFIYRDAED